jgi:putative SOS response-associated peptidase YedK
MSRPEFEYLEKLKSLLRPYRADEMTAYPVRTQVNSGKSDFAGCTDPA